MTVLDFATTDLIASQANGRLYATVPGSAGHEYGNSVVEIDPDTGTTTKVLPVGSEPSILARSDNGTTFYVTSTE